MSIFVCVVLFEGFMCALLVLCTVAPTALAQLFDSAYASAVALQDIRDISHIAFVWAISHYNDVIMGTIASQITSRTNVYSTVYSDADQRKHQGSASLAFVRGIHRGSVNSPHKWPLTRKMFPFDDIIMLQILIPHIYITCILLTLWPTHILVGSILLCYTFCTFGSWKSSYYQSRDTKTYVSFPPRFSCSFLLFLHLKSDEICILCSLYEHSKGKCSIKHYAIDVVCLILITHTGSDLNWT